ncbi:MAG: fasciclin domain-containing protein [Odoribacter sp.]
MKYIILILLTLGLLSGCEPKDNFIDTGISYGVHNCTMFEYLQMDLKNWDLTIELIRKAKMESYFEGKESGLEQITFLAPPSLSILRYLMENELKTVNELDEAQCREFLLRHIIKGRIMKEDIAFRIPEISSEIKGGTMVECLGGNQLKLYLEQEEWGGVSDAGAIHLFVYSLDKKRFVPMATPNLQTNTGIVHALNYNFTLGNI